MKKLLLTLILLTSIGYIAQAQVLFDFDFEIETKVKDGQTLANVTIILNIGETPIKYQIMPEGEPYGESVFESDFTNKRKFKFKNVPEGKYLAKVLDEQGRMAFHIIVIAEN